MCRVYLLINVIQKEISHASKSCYWNYRLNADNGHFRLLGLREPTRLEHFAAAELGRSIETGANLFKNNCSNCHGVNGKAEECYDPASGELIGCQGLPLNYQPLLCGDATDRMIAMNWQGTKQAFIQSTIASGRPGTVMPTWSDQFGGPMRPDQIRNLANFVLNWESEELCSGPVITFDWAANVEDFLAAFPDGDGANGKALFVTYGCSGCHGVPDEGVAAAVGPDLSAIAETGATVLKARRPSNMFIIRFCFRMILLPRNARTVLALVRPARCRQTSRCEWRRTHKI